MIVVTDRNSLEPSACTVAVADVEFVCCVAIVVNQLGDPPRHVQIAFMYGRVVGFVTIVIDRGVTDLWRFCL